MITSSKSIMESIAKAALERGDITEEEYNEVAVDFSIPTVNNTVRAYRIHPQTDKVINSESISLRIVAETVTLTINSGKVTKVWRMPLERWHELNEETGKE